ncbi:cytidylyltransferase domain-containing protein [Brevibacillus sp. NRS-1366]|uniref:cytidylyltransferase domain-containing protein n=1 Tax=Brevibacillus sp. NRS-1366 TaxID=3233899 RepID=UPI003D1FD89A
MKIGVLITARLKSTRLPLKLLHMIKGKRVIEHVIERCKAVISDQVFLCTSFVPQDAPLVEVAQKQGVSYFTGHPDDVLRRLYDAANFFHIDYILSVTADDPFFSIEYANRMVNEAYLHKPDFMYVEGLPIGVGIYGIRFEALKTVIEFKHQVDTEIWGYWFNQPGFFNVHTLQAPPQDRRDVRLTLDTYEDLMFLQLLGENLANEEAMSYHALLRIIDQFPPERQVNRSIVQRQLPDEIKVEIEARFTSQRERFLELKEKNYRK